jgi:hypothetical protein
MGNRKVKLVPIKKSEKSSERKPISSYTIKQINTNE